MKTRILVPAALLFLVAAGPVNAQMADIPDRDQTGNLVPMAPGNPNTSTIVTPEVPNTSSSPMDSSDTNAEPLNAMTPSGGNPDATIPRNNNSAPQQ
jgi:hypothetical protein